MKRRDFLVKSTFTALLASTAPASFFSAANASEQQPLLISPTIQPRVLLAPDASKSELFAARELVTYLQKITGRHLQMAQSAAKPPVSAKEPLIVVGHHPLNADLAAQIHTMEETLIDASPGLLRLVGGKAEILNANGKQFVQDRGTLYAVYNFLDELGVRWYRPEAWGEHVPQMQNIKVSLGRRHFKPVYSWRMGFDEYQPRSDGKPGNADGRMWEVRNRQNMVTGASEEQGGWRDVLAWENYPNILPAATYFAEHPEYFALIGGVRRKDAQLCIGNTDVQQLAAQKVLAYAQANPQCETYSLEPGDNCLWCQCELCKAMDDPNQKMIVTHFTINIENPMGDVSMSNRTRSRFGVARR